MDPVAKEKLKQWKKDHQLMKEATKKPKEKKSEQLSHRDWEDIMGKNRPTYKRQNGSFRQRG
ncbi:hypothetical protein ACIQD3_22625 [Peribacillus loiseleuriae]|uniref:hypothetical protein n=1 Tax=Peribacillus loiseleuriae TaxID=1679170 RepID=UPI0038179C75